MFDASGVRPLEEQTILITGSTQGLGRRVARELAARGATVLLHGRDQGRLQEAAAETGAARTYLADLSSLSQVRRLAGEVTENEDRLDVLVNNAGMIATNERQESEDGYELGFAVNYLSHFLLTELLLPLLRASAPSRIVNVSSAGQSPIDFEDVMLERDYENYRSYGQSKLAQVMHALELAERETAVTANALHPATLMDTKMVRQTFGQGRTSVEEGAEATLRLIADPELDGVTGRYFDGTGESTADPQAYDAEARKRLWALSEELTG
jgi:NAD(P)-dependent dehydrogenase (short-subunit alcohol dehydrogenase family)